MTWFLYLWLKLKMLGRKLWFLARFSLIDDFVVLGKNVKIYNYVKIYGDTQIGNDVLIGSHVTIQNDVIIGNNCRIGDFSFLPAGTRIGDNVFLGQHVSITNHKHPEANLMVWNKQGVAIENGASIGTGAVILPGLTIEKNAIIGAGAVVTKNVPAYETWVGVPARKLK